MYDLAGRDVVIAPHLGVIDADIWLKCRLKIMKNRQLARTNKGKRTWLTGKVKCKKCGYAYIVTKSDTKAGRYFQCSGARYAMKCKGAGCTIYADVFEGYVLQEIKKQLAEFPYLSDEPEAIACPTDHSDKVRIAEIEKEIESLLLRVSDANKTLIQYINRRIEELDMEKLFLQQKRIGQNTKEASEKINKITDYMDKLEKLDIDDKQRIADILIDRIDIGEGVIEIRWNA